MRPRRWRLVVAGGLLASVVTARAVSEAEDAVSTWSSEFERSIPELEVAVATAVVEAWQGRRGAVADPGTSEIVRERVREQLVPDLRGPWLAWSGAQAGARLELVVDLPMPALEGGERTTHPTVRVLDVVVEVRAASLGTRATWVTEAEGAGAWADDAVLRVLAPRLVPKAFEARRATLP